MNETLTILTPDPERGAQTLARCHARLTKQRRLLDAQDRSTAAAPDPARWVVAGLCAAQLILVANQVVRVIRTL